MLPMKFIAVSIPTGEEEISKNTCFKLEMWEMIPNLGEDRKHPSLFSWGLCNCDTRPDNSNSGKENNFKFRWEILMIWV